jgi:glycosyltransferase involved in cell wall biosynthesis
MSKAKSETPVTEANTELPFISIITCSYKRQKFFQNIQNMVQGQDYPHDKMEWIIMDDTPDIDSSSLFPESLDGIKVRYYYLKRKIPLATKRNMLNYKAEGKYIVNMDDDDYYPPCRVSHAVETLMEKGTPLVGSSMMFMFFSKDRSIYQLGPYHENHGTAATLAYTKEYTESHDFGDGNYAEEGVFTEGWKQPIAQLDPMKTVLALSHSDNTIEKTMFLEEKYGHIGRSVHETKLTLNDFVNKDTEKLVYEFYDQLSYEYKSNEYTKEVIEKMERNANESVMKYRQVVAQRMIQDLSVARTMYEKEMLFIHEKNVGRLVIQQGPPPGNK